MVEILTPKKPIDENPIAYLVDLIISFSKTISKGRGGLSKNGVKALLLFLLTAGLLYAHTELPSKPWDIVKLYSVPFIFLLYFFVDLGKNIGWVNRFFKKLQQRTDFIYENIMEDTISHEDLELYLMTLSFSYEQIKTIIQKLVDSAQFTPNIQKSLLQNKIIYRVDTFPLIKDSLINSGVLNNIDWAPPAVCIFLSNENENLPKEYLDKLINKYREHPSVLFAIGYFNQYKKDEPDIIYFKMGYEFKYTASLLKFFRFLVFLTGIITIFLAILISPHTSSVK